MMSIAPLDDPPYRLEIVDGGPAGLVGQALVDVPAAADHKPTGVDRGDFYWHMEEQVPLLRRDGEFVVSLANVALRNQVVNALTRDGGLLEGYSAEDFAGRKRLLLTATDPAQLKTDLDLTRIHEIEGVEWAAPMYETTERYGFARAVLTGRLEVALKPGVNPSAVFTGELANKSRFVDNQYLVTLEDASSALAVANQLNSDPRVEWAAPEFESAGRVDSVPNDPLFGNQWNLNNTSQFGALNDADADLPAAWDTTTGRSTIVVAVLDNGVQTNHPDLSANIFVNSNEIAANGIDDDSNGYIDDLNGWDFAGNDNNANPFTIDDNHGTAVAGIVGAVGNNSIGVSGAEQNVKILPIKIANDPGTGGGFITPDKIAKAVYYAAGAVLDGNGAIVGRWRGADVLNNSWTSAPDPMLTAAFDWASTNGRNGLGVASLNASGNDASGTTPQYSPRSFNVDVSSLPSAPWSWVLGYKKDAATIAGEDSIRLGRFINTDGANTRWDSLTPPSGWSMTPFVGQDGWYIEDNPARAHGTGRYQARSTVIGNSDEAYIMAPAITTGTSMTSTLYPWISAHSSDSLNVYLFNHTTSLLYSFGPGFTVAGSVPTIDSNVSYPASLGSTIAVGASSDWDYRSAYSQYGSELDIVAPSGGGYTNVQTTDRTGTAGYNTASGTTGDYTAGFSGTSAAAPLAAGIAALLLSKNSNLTAAQVKSALINTADKIGGNNGATAYVSGFNQYYGYGRVNANAALASISADTTPPKVTEVIIGGTSTTHADYAVPDGDGNQVRTVTVGPANEITIIFDEPVQVQQSDLQVSGKDRNGNVTNFSFSSFQTDPGPTPGSFKATWVTTQPFGSRQMSAKLTSGASNVRDLVGNNLDGEWDNPSNLADGSSDTFSSGNGSAGGNLSFSFTSLLGDTTLGGGGNVVDGGDYTTWADNFLQSGTFTFTQADWNGNASVDAGDYTLWGDNYLTDFTGAPYVLSALPGVDYTYGPEGARRFIESLYTSGNRDWRLDARRFLSAVDAQFAQATDVALQEEFFEFKWIDQLRTTAAPSQSSTSLAVDTVESKLERIAQSANRVGVSAETRDRIAREVVFWRHCLDDNNGQPQLRPVQRRWFDHWYASAAAKLI